MNLRQEFSTKQINNKSMKGNYRTRMKNKPQKLIIININFNNHQNYENHINVSNNDIENLIKNQNSQIELKFNNLLEMINE